MDDLPGKRAQPKSSASERRRVTLEDGSEPAGGLDPLGDDAPDKPTAVDSGRLGDPFGLGRRDDGETAEPVSAAARPMLPSDQSRKSLMEELFGREADARPGRSEGASAGYSPSAPREPRRGRRASAAAPQSSDPFGYLSASAQQFGDALPDWLTAPTRPEPKSPPAPPAAPPSTAATPGAGPDLTTTLLGMELERRAAAMDVQRQEHELRTAAALRRQTDQLNRLLDAQKAKLDEQERRFDALMAKQLERQALIEAQIRAQQDRIDGHLRSLAAQPTALPLVCPAAPANDPDSANAESTEATLTSLREKHDREVAVLEQSFKQQVARLQEAVLQADKWAQDRVEALDAEYSSKIQRLKEELSDCERVRKEEKALLAEESSILLRDIQVRHRDNLEMLQREHTEIIDKLTKSRESERQAMEIMRTDGTNVQSILSKSQLLMENLENLQQKFENKDKHFGDVQENHFSIQQKNIEYMKNLLESQKEAFNKEKQTFIATTQKLESNIADLTKEFSKQNASLQISEEILKTKEQALLRDREIFADQMNWERERLKSMMDAWAKEEDKQLEWLAQERQAVASERAKLQIFNRLNHQVDESSKIELEAAIKTAQEAAFNANQERVKWQQKIQELDKKKHILKEEEHLLVQKAKELQEFTQSAISKREEGLKALKEARFIEQRYKEKFNQLHSQQEILIEKESKLATEKLELAKTRLSLYVNEIEKPEKDIDDNNKICRNKQVLNHSDVPTTTSEYTTYFKDIVDPHLITLKWDLENNLGFLQTTF
ncbi:putative protein tag-278 isoform X2 [Phymastichus coffea]|uniref:putative protein tag-278 isoform X2 n=1 Tax=Phymastichus coffea TaxID=108790 RepID=UPI00273BE59E|nr:putative protein tag-278 isoform X2 [Phymastichus coffea]